LMLPKDFSWLEQGKVAGSARPESEEELEGVKKHGVKAIVSLTGTPINPEVVSRLGFDYLHAHISGAPTIDLLDEIVRFIELKNAESKPVLVHCGEGIGRTGTVLAAYLVYHGLGAEDAIKRVRELRPGSIQNLEQENAVREFERRIRRV
jgi:atypical dual specificity phosphatase